MNKTLVSSVSIALSLGVVVPAFAMASAGEPAFAMASAGEPAFAYVPNMSFERQSHREEVQAIKETRDVRNINKPSRRQIQTAGLKTDALQERAVSSVRSADSDQTKNTHLERTRRVRVLRRFSRSPKQGSDRYRVLRPNTRSLRLEAESSYLPPMIVQTGQISYDRPTRRAIRENGYFSGILDRDRDVLKEMSENKR
ncbi:MAG: hypothetical protein K9M03_01100 [Kiritimatiellales bacterium]|nr:hypothetical protein [Kiritimatiellales bacterium]